AEAIVRLRERQMAIALWRREEPLVAAQSPSAVAVPFGTGEIAAYIGAALSLGHAHADQSSAFRGDRQRAGIVVACQHAGKPHVRDGGMRSGMPAQNRNARISHR